MGIKNLFDLTGKTALVTGGSQGIGKSISLALAEFGADIVINYRSNDGLAVETAREITGMGRKCWLIKNDISKLDSFREISDFVKKENIEIDILVLNASVQYRTSWDKVPADEFETQINTNFRASLFLIQEFYPAMEKKGWGRIVTVGSVQQLRPHKQMIVYAASKMAQMSMVKSLAHQFAAHGVTINNLAPGTIMTGRNEGVLQDATYKALVESKIPMGYIGDPDDCAGIALVLCSDAGRYITGQDVYADGGMGLNF